MPDAHGYGAAHDRKWHEEHRPPVPTPVVNHVANAKRLQATAEIGETVNDTGARGGSLATAEIGGGSAGHKRGDADGAKNDKRRGETDDPLIGKKKGGHQGC